MKSRFLKPSPEKKIIIEKYGNTYTFIFSKFTNRNLPKVESFYILSKQHCTKLFCAMALLNKYVLQHLFWIKHQLGSWVQYPKEISTYINCLNNNNNIYLPCSALMLPFCSLVHSYKKGSIRLITS